MPSPEEFQNQFRLAVTLVIRDAETTLGSGIITHVVDDDLEAALRELGPDVMRVPGYVIGSYGSGVDFSFDDDVGWPDFVVRAAESIQQAVNSDPNFFGPVFPPCPVHPNHSMDPEVVGGKPCWACPQGSIEPIEIGHYPDSSGS